MVFPDFPPKFPFFSLIFFVSFDFSSLILVIFLSGLPQDCEPFAAHRGAWFSPRGDQSRFQTLTLISRPFFLQYRRNFTLFGLFFWDFLIYFSVILCVFVKVLRILGWGLLIIKYHLVFLIALLGM